jgi:hypothetical protein
MKFTYIDEPKEKKKRRPIKSKEERYKDAVRQGHIADSELQKEYEEFKTTYCRIYEYKLICMNDTELINEIIYILNAIATMSDPLIDTYGEDNVIKHQTKYAGFVTFSVKQNVMIRYKAKLCSMELNRRFNEFIVDRINLQYPSLYDALKKKCVEHNATLISKQFNMNYLSNKADSLGLQPNNIVSGCLDCRGTINSLKEIASDLTVILRLSTLIEFDNLNVVEGKLIIKGE